MQNQICQLKLVRESPDKKHGEQELKSVGTSILEKHHGQKGKIQKVVF